MGSDGEGRASEAVAARKPRKRQLVMESSDAEEDEYCISTRQNAGATSSSNAGFDTRVDGDHLGKESMTFSSDNVSRVKDSDGDGSEKNKGLELKISSQPDAKKIIVEGAQGGGGGSSGGASKGGTTGKKLRPGFPSWRFEKPEVRGGRVLDKKDGMEMKASSASKVKEQVSSLDDKRRRVELQTHEKQTPLKTDQSRSVDSDLQEVIRLQGKRGVLRILPKNDKVVRDTGVGKILLKNTKVDGETGAGNILMANTKVDGKTVDGRIPTKKGVLKILGKNNSMVTETNYDKLLPNNIKVDGENESDRILTKNTIADKEISDRKALKKKTRLDGQFDDHKVPRKNSAANSETIAGKFLPRSSKEDGDSYRVCKEKSGVLADVQKQDANGEKRFTGKLVSPVMLRKSDPSVVGVSLGQSIKQQNPKQQLKITSVKQHEPSLSQKNENTKLSEHKNLKKRLLEHKGMLENLSKKPKSKTIDLQGTSDPALKKMKKPRGGPRNKLKQDVRNQIKRVLLDNGWKIDLRRRKNKDYEDSVYVSPEGTGYWSITKAYAVFQKEVQNPDNENMGCSSKFSKGASDAISQDDLAMLKKNIVKRRTKKEVHGAGKKSGGSRSRSPKNTLADRSSRNKHHNREDWAKMKHRGCGLLVRGSTHNVEDKMDDYIPYEWKRTVYSWMIDQGVVSEHTKVKYMNSKGAKAMLEGKLTREGIYCGCCSKILTVSKFELHAGSKEQQPYANVFIEDGTVSLLQCLHDAWEKHTRYEKKGFYKIDNGDDEHDDTCAICGDGGDLLCCDRCASTFHVACLRIKMPSGDWFCRSCLCRFCGSAQEKTSSSPELLSCLQCSRKYHLACAPGTGRDSVCTKPTTSNECFCSQGCRKISKRLKKLLGVKNYIEAGFSWSLVHCFADSQAILPKNKAQLVHCNSKTALAFAVMDECFRPHVDDRSGINMIHNVVYNCGSDFSRLDFSGFYTFILERGDEVISVASVRIHGIDLAEMPFIGTRGMYRNQGMCRRLLNAVESALSSLNVRKLVIPAVPEMENTWTTVFGFKPIEPSKRQRIKSINLLVINGTGLLEKRLLPTGTVDGQINARPANAVRSDKTDAQMFGEASGSVTPVHVSHKSGVPNDLENKCHESPSSLLGNSTGLASDQPSGAKENGVQSTLDRASPVSVGDVKSHFLPGVDCGDNVQFKAEVDNIQEGKHTETNGHAEGIVAEQKCEYKSNPSHSNSLAIQVTAYPFSLSSDIGEGGNRPSSGLSIEAASITDKAEFNLPSNCQSACCANQENQMSCVTPVDANVSLVTMDEKTDKHELNTTAADVCIQRSTEDKGLEDTTNIVNGTSIDACRDKDTSEDHNAFVIDCGISVVESVRRTEIIKDKVVPLLPDLKYSSSTDMQEKLTESKSIKSGKVEMDDATIKVGMTDTSYNEAGITAPVLGISNDVCGVVVKPTQTCGEDQLHGEDVIYSNSMEDDLASREPVA